MAAQKHCFRRIAAFLLVLFAVLQLLSAALKPKCILSSLSNEQPDSLDYIVLGDSESYSSVSPMELWEKYGFAGFDCGIGGQKIQDTYYLLQEILKVQNPKVILLETNLLFRNQTAGTVTEELADRIFGELVYIYQYHDIWEKLIFPHLADKAESAMADTYNGMPIYTNIKGYTGGAYVHVTSSVKQIGKLQRIFLDKITELCKDQNIQLILYSAPSPVNWSFEEHNGIAQYARENGLVYLDLNLNTQKIGIDWETDTRDSGDHLNIYGVVKTTAYLGAYLKEHTSLTDHRSEAEYAGWRERLIEYRTAIGSTADEDEQEEGTGIWDYSTKRTEYFAQTNAEP